MPEVLVAVSLGVVLGCPDRDDASDAETRTSGDTDAVLPQCPAGADEPACTASVGCAWEADVGCVVDCEQLDDQLTCETLDYCYWIPAQGGCVWGIA